MAIRLIIHKRSATRQVRQRDPERYFNYMLNKIRECKMEEDYKALLPFNIDPADLNK